MTATTPRTRSRRSEESAPWASFKSDARFRGYLLLVGSRMVLFWVVALTASAWLMAWGLTWLVVVLGTIYALRVIPALIAQVEMIVDFGNYLFTRNLHVIPQRYDKIIKLLEGMPPEVVARAVITSGWALRLGQWVGDSTPTAPLAYWAFGVVMRGGCADLVLEKLERIDEIVENAKTVQLELGGVDDTPKGRAFAWLELQHLNTPVGRYKLRTT